MHDVILTLETVSVCLSLLGIPLCCVFHLFLLRFVYLAVVSMHIVFTQFPTDVNAIQVLLGIHIKFVVQANDVMILDVGLMHSVLKDLSVLTVFVQLVFKEIHILDAMMSMNAWEVILVELVLIVSTVLVVSSVPAPLE